jgi:hypothetical protein
MLATTACCFWLEDTPTVIASVDAKVGFSHDERDVVTSNLRTGSTSKDATRHSDSLTHSAGELLT